MTGYLSRIAAVVLVATMPAWADNLKVTVKDASGAVVAGAAVRVLSEGGGEAGAKRTNLEGSVEFPDLAAGKYHVEPEKEGFEIGAAEANVASNRPNAIEVTLKILAPETSVEVAAGASKLANSDQNYLTLRSNSIGEAFVAENVILKRDLGEFTFVSGTIAFTKPVAGRTFIAVFNGEGHFHLKPRLNLESRHLQFATGRSEADEDFDSAVLVFTDKTAEDLRPVLRTPASPAKAEETWRSVERRLRQRSEIATSFSQYELQGDGIRNIDAELPAAVYNPKGYSSFTAYIHGRRHPDLRFFFNPLGAIQDFESPEEVALVNVDPVGMQDGIWYPTHLDSEWSAGHPSSGEDRTSHPL